MTQYIPYGLILKCHEIRQTDTLSYWIKLRAVKVVYNYNIRNIAGILKISPTTASKHMKNMFALGLVHFRGKNLVSTGNNKLKEIFGQKMSKIKVFKRKRTQKLALYAQILGQNLSSQQKKINQKLSILKKLRTNQLTTRQAKKLDKLGGVAAFVKSFHAKTVLSNKRIGKMLKITPRTATNYQRDMSSSGIIEKRANFKFIGECGINCYYRAKELNRTLVFSNNNLYRQLPNQIILLAT